MSKKIKELVQKRKDLEAELVAIKEKLAEEESRAESWVSAAEARNALAQFSDPNGAIPYPRLLPIVETLVALRPEPIGSAGFGEVLFTWRSEENRDWEVKVDKRDGEVILVFHGESMSFDFTPEQAGEVGRWLLGAAEIGQKIEDKS